MADIENGVLRLLEIGDAFHSIPIIYALSDGVI
jgi:hypothetical protein